jgi:titin
MGMVHARFTDDILSQVSAAVTLASDGAEIVLEDLPVVDIEQENMTVNLGAGTALTAVARDESGSPMAGQKLTLKSSVTGAAKSCTGAKMVSTTNSLGVATFKVCPVKSATWTVDGKAIVGSAGVRLTVQLTPTAPRTLAATSKTRSVSLVWVAPAKANASTVTDYTVQYRLQGATTWVTFRDGTSTARKATVTGLTSGQIYEFRVAAKNRSGAGTWSVVVPGTPN